MKRSDPALAAKESPKTCQQGLTMVELLVALTLSMLIALAAIAALTVARQGFNTVDAASQLRDNGRFASDLVQRLAMQSGYKDVIYAGATRASEFNMKGANANPDPYISGFNNSLISSASDPLSSIAARTATAGGCASSSDTACVNGSDILVLRYQSSALLQGSSTSDNTMLNCMGNPESSVPTASDEQMISIFHVAKSSSGEPALMCTSRNNATGSWGSAQPIIQGVESFQVLYGVDSVTPNTAPTGTPDTVPERYLRADQMTVASNEIATNNNWRRVRSLRIGMLLRGPIGSAQDRNTQIFLPLGGLNGSSDAGSSMTFTGGTPAASTSNFIFAHDGRLRQVMTLTVYLRNVQTQ